VLAGRPLRPDFLLRSRRTAPLFGSIPTMKCGVSISLPAERGLGCASRGGTASRLPTAVCACSRNGREAWRSGEEVLALLLPAKLDHLVVLGVEHRGQIVWGCSDRNRAGLGIRAPSVLNLQKQMTSKATSVASPTASFPALANPGAAGRPRGTWRVSGGRWRRRGSRCPRFRW